MHGAHRDQFQTLRHNFRKRRYLHLKRILDVTCAIGGMIVLLPLLVCITIVIKIDSKGPAVYKHKRIGKNGAPFWLYKFRSMHENADEMFQHFTPEQMIEWNQNFKLKNDPRVTRVGKFLRESSMDELPQLLNILQGNLSLVGPRPVTQAEVDRYGENKEKFLSVTPGLTGYWQAYARSSVDYRTRMEMELYYIDHFSLWWDIKIVCVTVGAVLRGTGAE